MCRRRVWNGCLCVGLDRIAVDVCLDRVSMIVRSCQLTVHRHHPGSYYESSDFIQSVWCVMCLGTSLELRNYVGSFGTVARCLVGSCVALSVPDPHFFHLADGPPRARLRLRPTVRPCPPRPAASCRPASCPAPPHTPTASAARGYVASAGYSLYTLTQASLLDLT